MIIEEIEVINAGRFEKLTATTEAGVVGVVGPNTAGKTTLLTMLKYAWDGELPDEAESYVRGWGKEGMPTNGSVRIRFRKHGSQGQIFRQFGKNPKRWLEWGEHTGKSKLTKAADVERVISEIMGADRRALSKAIFVPQGAFDKLFFGKTSEREAMLVDLLVSAQLEKIEHVLDGKIKALSLGVQDLAVLSDDAQKRRGEAEQRYAYLENELAKSRDWSKDLALLREMLQTTADANRLLAQIEGSQQQKESIASRLDALLAQPIKLGTDSVHHPVNLHGLKAVLQTHRDELADMQKQQIGLTEEAARNKEIRDKVDRIQKLQSSLADLQQSIKLISPIALQDVEDMTARLVDIRRWEAANREQEAAMQAMLDAGLALSNFDKQNAPPDPDELHKYEQTLEEMLESYNTLQLKHDVRAKVAGKAVSECPICNQPVDPKEISQAMVAGLAAELEGMKALGKELRTKLTERKEALRVYHETRARLAGESGAAGSRFQKAATACGPKPQGDAAHIEKCIQNIQRARGEKSTLENQLRSETSELTILEAFHEGLAEEDVARAHADKGQILQIINESIKRWQARIQGLRGRLDAAEPLAQEDTSLLRLINEHTVAREAALDQGKRLIASFEESLSAFVASGEGPEMLEEKVEKRQQLAGEVRQAKAQADKVREEQVDLERRSDEDGKRRALIDDLRKLRQTFVRTGLPMRYVRHKFDKLVELTRLNLAKMDANFTVDVDPTSSVSFTFTMLGEDDPYIMPQSKLSGGQKVRLSTAFLLAIQQLIIPEVAFLVLDEPSLHLDKDGRENLRDMLVNMGEQLNNAQSQIWVCDHSQELESAYGKIIPLRPQRE